MIQRDPHSLGLALGESNQLIANCTTLAAHSAALADGVFATERHLPGCKNVAVQARGVTWKMISEAEKNTKKDMKRKRKSLQDASERENVAGNGDDGHAVVVS